jgi:hypothetical protein
MSTDLAAARVSEESMLQFCVVDGCTTVVFGAGTCLQHDRERTAAQSLTDEATQADASNQPSGGHLDAKRRS